MTTIYSGNPNNVSNALTRSITGCADNGSGLIRVTTSTSHLFSSFDTVFIIGVLGTTEANGTWSITVIDATHFDLVGSAFANAYMSGGTATDRSLTPAGTFPSDGEPGSTASILAAMQLLFDRTQFLATHPFTPTTLIVPPTPFNLSYARNWTIGDETSVPSRVVKTVADDSALVIDITTMLGAYAGHTLARVSATFAVGQTHAAVPAVLPSLRLFRTQSLTTLGVAPGFDQSLLSTTTSSFPTPGSGAAYYDSGHLQSWYLDTDQNNVIDATRRTYIVLIDESGANSHPGNIYLGFQLTVNP